MKKLGSYKGFQISIVEIKEGDKAFNGYIAIRTGMTIESPIDNPLNRRALKQAINETLSK